MIEFINYCLGGDGPGRKWTEKCSKKKKRRIRKEELEVHKEEQRNLEVQEEKPNADKGEGDCIKFDLRDEDTFDVKECPVGRYFEGLSFEDIYNILTTGGTSKGPACMQKTRWETRPSVSSSALPNNCV